jgi:hypothetical protein
MIAAMLCSAFLAQADFPAAHQQAQKQHLPLVVFAGVPAVKGPWISYTQPRYSRPGVTIYHRDVLYLPRATAVEITRALTRVKC